MDELDRLFLRLVRAVRDTRPEYLSRPFEVREMLEFVPYRSVRTEVGVDTNDDYAHAITRLLSGERGYLFADDLLQDDLRAELGSPNPDLVAFQAYTNAFITLSQEHTRQALEGMDPPAVLAPAPEAEALPPRPAAARRPRRPSSSRTPRALDPEADAPVRPSRPGCRYCGQPLPEGREVHFCPSCGQNLLMRRCAACSAEIEQEWKFCVACGRTASP